MEIKQGYSYHVKNEFFDLVKDKMLMSNKEDDNYRPHYYAVNDLKNDKILWMIPISSQVGKYKEIIEKKKKKYKKCNTILIGVFAGKENAFLIQNSFPIIRKFIDHIHIVEDTPIQVHKELDKKLRKNLKEVIAMRKQGINLLYTDVDRIMEIMVRELDNDMKSTKIE